MPDGLMGELDKAVRAIGRLCSDPECPHCVAAQELADEVHGYKAGLNGYTNRGCRCLFCRESNALRTRTRRLETGTR